MEEPNENGVKSERDEKGRFVEGNSGSPGRPPGAKNKFSFVQFWQELWEENPEQFKELAKKYLDDDKLAALVIQMIDGRPKQDITSDGKAFPTPIYGGQSIQEHDGNKEDIPAKEEN